VNSLKKLLRKMKQVIQNYKTGQLKLEEVPMPAIRPGGVLVQNAHSVISVGTERQSIENARKSLIGKAKARPEQAKQVIRLAKQQGLLNAYRMAMNQLSAPVPLGYSSAGVVMEVGERVNEFRVGESVACAGGGYANHAEVVFVPKNLCAKVPDKVSLDHAAFTTLGAIAVQGVRQADVKIGENVAVVGLGLIGQLTVQIAKVSGCNVLGIDIDSHKVNLAKELGVDMVAVRGKDSIKSIADSFTHGIGVDAVIITAATLSNDPFLLAPEIIRDRGKVVLVGVAKLDFPRKPYYRKEITLSISRSYGPGRYDENYEEKGIDYPVGYVRWTEKRNMEAFLRLLSQGKINLDPLITHRFKIEDALEAYDLILGRKKEKCLGVLLEYDIQKAEKWNQKIILQPRTAGSQPQTTVLIGFIGAGHFATGTLLPCLKKTLSVDFRGVVTASGLSARNVAKKYGFKYCTSDYQEILNDRQVNTIFIATRHNLHAQLAIESLKAGKAVFVEKPLALDEEKLNKIIETYNDLISNHQLPKLMIGFNRRFAPLTKEVRKFFEKRTKPLAIVYRVNAGFIPKGHWTQDLEESGGRIIGEICHFVDLIQYLTESEPIRVFAEAITNDTLNISLRLKDSSIGSINYLANGDASYPKERVEIFGEGSVAVIDDFKRASFTREGRTKRIKQIHQNKGHKEEIEAFVEAVKRGEEMPIKFEEIIATTLATFKIIESLEKGVPVTLVSLPISF